MAKDAENNGAREAAMIRSLLHSDLHGAKVQCGDLGNATDIGYAFIANDHEHLEYNFPVVESNSCEDVFDFEAKLTIRLWTFTVCACPCSCPCHASSSSSSSKTPEAEPKATLQVALPCSRHSRRMIWEYLCPRV
jgi:hypothetical protein